MKIITLGDSLMQENGPETYPQEGWPQELHYFLQNPLISVLDLGLNGRSTKSFIDEGHFADALKRAEPGDVVFLSFGHNDEKKEDPTRYTDPYGAYQSYLALMNGRFQEKGCLVFFITSMSRLHYDDKGVLLHTHGEYPKAMKEVAARLGRPCFDLEAISYDFLSHSSFDTNSGYYMIFDQGAYPSHPEASNDASHLSERGAKMVCRLLWGEFKKDPELESLFI
jgi:lysophospholipase L1-like esterase